MSCHISRKSFLVVSTLIASSAGIGSLAFADPLPNEELKFYQSPLNGAPPPIYPVGATPQPGDIVVPFQGQDILSTVFSTPSSGTAQGNMAADDFSDNNPLPIGHITWWGSYIDGTDPSAAPLVQQFQISLYTDVPGAVGTANTFSHPGTLIATQVVNAGPLSYSSGTFSASPLPPGSSGAPLAPGDSPLVQYNAELNWLQNPFPDAFNGNVEWLSIVALEPADTAPTFEWGWHDRDWGISDPLAAPGFDTAAPPYHGGDDAVTGSYNGNPSLVGGFVPQDYNPQYDGAESSMDLAFALYTVPTSVPEPASIGLLGLTIPMLLARRRGKQTH